MALEPALETALECFGWLWTVLQGVWKALESNRTLARNLLNVRNHVLSDVGKHILLNRCYASLKRDCTRKSKIRVLTIGESTFFNIHQDSLGCYVRSSKCRIRALTTGEETIFEDAAWQLV